MISNVKFGNYTIENTKHDIYVSKVYFADYNSKDGFFDRGSYEIVYNHETCIECYLYYDILNEHLNVIPIAADTLRYGEDVCIDVDCDTVDWIINLVKNNTEFIEYCKLSLSNSV